MTLAHVLLPQRLEKTYTYFLPPTLVHLPEGSFVRVPFGSREKVGILWRKEESAKEETSFKIKEVLVGMDVPALPEKLRRFAAWLAQYTLTPVGLVLKMVLPKDEHLELLPETFLWTCHPPLKPLTPTRQKVCDLVARDPYHTSAHALGMCAGVSPQVVSALEKAGVLSKAPVLDGDEGQGEPDLKGTPAVLSPEQNAAAKTLCHQVEENAFCVTLLDGVTGSGKTQVYLEAVAKALSKGRQVLILLPEISLTPQGIARFENRFGVSPLLWHSGVGPSAKRKTWHRVLSGNPCVVIGARSALFLPFSQLGLIVVDEEHEHAYKQEQGVFYHARDMAVVRARLERVPLILASATPSVETVVNVTLGKYTCLKLTERFAKAVLPTIELVDLRVHKKTGGPRRWICDPMVQALTQNLAAGAQSLLFLNRRGYAPLTLCRSCGERVSCAYCSSWLVEHRSLDILMCHQCGHKQKRPQACPSCEAPDALVACGPGVERLHEEVTALFPKARVGMIASDQGSVQLRQDLLSDMEEGRLDILIGTQMIAKGHHFPGLVFVGVVDADLGLCGGDLRACERTYQLLHQVSGRCGREEVPGHVMIQSFAPDHPVMQALSAGDRDAFMTAEIDARRLYEMPPFARLVAFIFSSTDEKSVEEAARAFVHRAPRTPGIMLMGPSPAPLAKVNRRWRWRVLAKADKTVKIHPFVQHCLRQTPMPSKVTLHVDVDPYSFL
jgi:primosomal protein N' (replication factor Y) (superfamily II helicase)